MDKFVTKKKQVTINQIYKKGDYDRPCPSVFFPGFLQTAIIDKPIPALFVGALQSVAIGGL